jgi:hypothetical protein
MSTQDLLHEISQKAGKEIANLIWWIEVYRGGMVKVRARTGAGNRLEDDSWVKKWLPSATLPKKEFWLLVSGVPVAGTAEQMAEILEKENRGQYFGLEISRSRWMGSTENRTAATLLISVRSQALADRLILNSMRTGAKGGTVRKFQKNYYRGKIPANPFYGRVGQGYSPTASEAAAEPTDDEVVFSSASESPLPIENLKRKVLQPSTQGRRGRPFGALNKSKFTNASSLGENPFCIASAQVTTEKNSCSSQESQSEEETDTTMVQC